MWLNEETQQWEKFGTNPVPIEKAHWDFKLTDLMPCYGCHGDINTDRGKMERELCPHCRERNAKN